MKILIQQLDGGVDQSAPFLPVGPSIAATVRRFENGACDYVFLRVGSADDIDVGFLRDVDTHAVVVDIELEASESVQAEFDYVVTVRPSQSARQQLAQPQCAPPPIRRADPANTPLPFLRGLLHRLMKIRPLGQPASA